MTKFNDQLLDRVGDRLLGKEVLEIDMARLANGLNIGFVLGDYSVIEMHENDVHRLHGLGKIGDGLFGRYLLKRLETVLHQNAMRLEDGGRVQAALLVLYATKDDQPTFDRLAQLFTGGKVVA